MIEILLKCILWYKFLNDLDFQSDLKYALENMKI